MPASTITPSQRARPVTNRLAALHHDATEPPAGGEIPDAESRDRLAAHADVAEDENDCDVAGAPAIARGPDELVHELWAG